MGTAETRQQPQTEVECKLLITGSYISYNDLTIATVM